MTNPLISVLVPAYNHGRYVQEAVRSVMAQDYPRLELIVVDDGSRDDTWAKLQALRSECESRFERVEMVTQANAGTCVTGNRLVAMSRGEYVLVIASDDQLLPGALSALAKVLVEDATVVLAVGQNRFMDGEGRRCFWGPHQEVVYDEEAAKYRSYNEALGDWCKIDQYGPVFGDFLTLVRGNHVPNGCLLRKSAFGGRDPFTPEAPLEDYWSMLTLAMAGRFVAIPADTFSYRWHGGNTMRDPAKMVVMTEKTLAQVEVRLRTDGRSDLLPGFEQARESFRAALREGAVGKPDSVGFWQSIGRFFFRIKRTERGLVVKVLKVPVYSRRFDRI